MLINEKDIIKGNIRLIIEYEFHIPIKYERIFGLNNWGEIIDFCNSQIKIKSKATNSHE